MRGGGGVLVTASMAADANGNAYDLASEGGRSRGRGGEGGGGVKRGARG